MKLFIKHLFYLLIFLFILVGFITYYPPAKTASAISENFNKTTLVSGLNFPTDFVLVPDGRIFISEQYGQVKVFKNGAILNTPLVSLPVSTEGEQGILGLILDPQFILNKFIYIYYVNKDPLEIRVSRFTISGDQVEQNSEKILLISDQKIGFIHHAGTLRFGADGKLYISVGNNSLTGNSQDLSNIHGKILRINKDGTIPTDNPFYNQSGKAQSIWAFGLRNPFRFNFLNNGQMLIGDVGDYQWEELNLGVKGGNYGYPPEGACSGCSSINPLFQYPHNGGSAAVVAGFQYNQNNFPQEYKNNFFYGDYSKGFIRRLVLDDHNTLSSDQPFLEDAGTVVEILPGSDGALYYLTIYPGVLYKVSYSPGNLSPVAVASATPTSGDLPLKVKFSSTGSNDPEGKKITYFWDFGDQTNSKEAYPAHTYRKKGVYKATLTVSDGQKTTKSEPIEIAAGIKYPVIQILTPPENFKYNAGQNINFSADAQDPQDGNLNASAFSWDIIFHHQTHQHPFISIIQNTKSGQFTTPDTGEASAQSWFEIKVTVKNSFGLTTSLSRKITPNVVKTSFDSQPSGAQILIDGIPVTLPFSVDGIVGFKKNIDITSPQNINDQNYQFERWSDNGAKSHQITTPNTDTTLTVYLKPAPTGSGNLKFRVTEFNSDLSWSGKYINDATVKLTDTLGNVVHSTKISTKRPDGEDGWVEFNDIQPGNYGILTYKNNFQGVWKKLDCQNPQGTFTNATLSNKNTQNYKAAWNNNVEVVAGKTTFCTDLGLQSVSVGDIRFRILEVSKNSTGYKITGFVNDATVKLTDTLGNTVTKTATSQKRADGEDGWVVLDGIENKVYGLMAYKKGYSGYLKKTDCSIESTENSTIKKNLTENLTAAWNNNVEVFGGKVTYCYDLGLTKDEPGSGNLFVRIAEFGVENNWLNKFINGATVKLTDPAGNLAYQTINSTHAFGQEEGWAVFENVAPGTYGILGYKAGYQGIWKKLDCQNATGTTTNASIKNQNTQDLIAAYNDNVVVKSGQDTWCTDLGLKQINKSNLRLRVTEFDQNNNWLGNYLNGVTVKLTDTSGTSVKSSVSTQTAFGGQDGWAFFEGIEPGNYGMMAYKTGFQGVWKKLGCENPAGDFNNAKITNPQTEGLVAAWNNNLNIPVNQTIYCFDLGLSTSP